VKQVVVTALVLGLLVVCASAVRAQGVEETFPMGASLTDDKPQSNPWDTDDDPTWWGILGDGTGSFFYKLVLSGLTSSFVKQTCTDAQQVRAPPARHVLSGVIAGRSAGMSRSESSSGS